MNRVRNIISLSTFALVMIALPTIASAQWNGGYGGYGNNGRYNSNIRGTVESLRNRARNFARNVDRIDDRRDDRQGGWGNNNRSDRFDQLDTVAERFARATENLRNEYGRGRNLDNSRDEAQRVLELGSQIDQIIYNGRRRNNNNRVAGDWNQIRNDLRIIADAYGNGNYNGGRNGNWRDRMPFPLPF
jgi:hypothetical protein